MKYVKRDNRRTRLHTALATGTGDLRSINAPVLAPLSSALIRDPKGAGNGTNHRGHCQLPKISNKFLSLLKAWNFMEAVTRPCHQICRPIRSASKSCKVREERANIIREMRIYRISSVQRLASHLHGWCRDHSDSAAFDSAAV